MASSTLPLDNSLIEEEVAGDETNSPADLLKPLIVAFACVFDSQQSFISVFTDADPTWHCLKSNDPICREASNPCELQPNSWVWDSPSRTSTISEWSLECSSKVISSLPFSSFFAGCLLGGLLFSTLADSVLGRKKLLVLSCLIMSVAGGLSALSPNIWVYCALRFVLGFGRSAVGTCSLVLCSEIANKRWRHIVSVSGFFFSALGFLMLPGIAYAGRRYSWRFLYLWTCAPAFVYAILINFIVPESPRWLSTQDQTDKATNIHDAFSSMKTLVTTRSTLWKLIAIMTVSFGISMAFYGMPLSVRSLSKNLYLSIVYNAVANLPTSTVSYLLIVNMKRRISIVAFTSFSGIASLICVFRGINSTVQLAAEVISFFCACVAVDVTLVYSIELFPTCIRNSAQSLVRQAILLGGILAPILVAEGRRSARFWSFGVFSIVVSFCGLSVIFLPETKGKELTDRMEEENQIDNNTA